MSNQRETTPIREREYFGKINAKTNPGLERAFVMGAFTVYPTIASVSFPIDKDINKHSYGSSIADREGRLVVNREYVHWLDKGIAFRAGDKFKAKKVLDERVSEGYLKEYSPYSYQKGVAREAKVSDMKGFSKATITLITHILDNSFIDLYEEIDTIFAVQDNNIYWEDDERLNRLSQIAAKAYKTAVDRERAEPLIRAASYCKDIKKIQQVEGITLNLLYDLVHQFIPGFQPERHKYVIEQLAMRYGYGDKLIQIQHLKNQYMKNMGITEIKGESIYNPSNPYGVKNEEISSPDHNTTITINITPTFSSTHNSIHISNPIHNSINLLATIHTTPSDTISSHTSVASSYRYRNLEEDGSITTIDITPLDEPTLIDVPLPSPSSPTFVEDCSLLRERATEEITKDSLCSISAHNEAIAYRAISYTPRDMVDLRQLESMSKGGFIPYEYRVMSTNSPRLYGRGADNLFYCRKEMRLALLEGLGFIDIDLQSCHIQIAVGLWGEYLPILKEHLDKGSIWETYREIYEREDIVFHKRLIKAMHHATFLGGGDKAYRKALNVYNCHVKEKIGENEFIEIVKVFKSTPFYKEIRGLFKYLDKKYHGKTLKTITGEEFKVRGYRKHKKEGKVIVDKGNLLTAISALLQSYEVTIMSYLILRCRGLFTPVLWQHDGITIKVLFDESIQLMIGVVNEISQVLLGRDIPLDVTYINSNGQSTP